MRLTIVFALVCLFASGTLAHGGAHKKKAAERPASEVERSEGSNSPSQDSPSKSSPSKSSPSNKGVANQEQAQQGLTATSSPSSPPAAGHAAAPSTGAEEPLVEISIHAILHKAIEHPHNKLVHVPIGFAFAILVLLLAGRGNEAYEPAVRWLSIGGAGGAVVSVVVGLWQGDSFVKWSPAFADIFNWHRALGIASGVLFVLVAVAFSGRIEALRKLRMSAFAVLFLVIGAAGLFGGWMSTEA